MVPVTVSAEGLAVFRLPNQWLMVGLTMLAAIAAAAGMTLRPQLAADAWRTARVAIVLTAAGLGWTLIATASSLDPVVSRDAWPFITSVLLAALLSSIFLRDIPSGALIWAISVPVLMNAVVVVLQAFQVWNPWKFEYEFQRMYKNGLLGNPNDVGAFLVGPLTMLTAAAVVSPRARIPIAGTVVIGWIGLLLSETLTAILGATAAVVAIAFLRYRSRAVLAVLLAITLLCAGAATYPPLRERVWNKTEAIERLQIDRLISGRLEAFLSAWEMFTDRPLLGVGPGVFKQKYMEYRVDLPLMWRTEIEDYSPVDEYFREVHNDHLQLLTEAGAPAYALLVAAFVMLARVSFTTRAQQQRSEIARLAAMPLVIGLAVTMLAGFPLQLAPSAYTFAVLGGACLAWRRA